jgi:aldehyde oxidoreductase
LIFGLQHIIDKIFRQQLLLTGTKVGGGQGQCGACNVILNSKLVRSCITKMTKVPDASTILTIEGIALPMRRTRCSWPG